MPEELNVELSVVFFGDTVVDGSEIWWSPIDIWYTPPQSLTWNLKKMVSTRNLLFQGAIFRFRVNLQGCIPFIYDGFLAPSNRWSLLFGISEPSTVAQLGRKKNTWFLPLQLGPLPNPFAKRGDFPSMGLSGDASSQVSIVHEWCVNLKKNFHWSLINKSCATSCVIYVNWDHLGTKKETVC